MQFIKHLLSNDGQISSKRFAGIVAFVNAVVLGYLPNTKEFVFNGFLLFAATVWGMTLFEKYKLDERSKDTREDTATAS